MFWRHVKSKQQSRENQYSLIMITSQRAYSTFLRIYCQFYAKSKCNKDNTDQINIYPSVLRYMLRNPMKLQVSMILISGSWQKFDQGEKVEKKKEERENEYRIGFTTYIKINYVQLTHKTHKYTHTHTLSNHIQIIGFFKQNCWNKRYICALFETFDVFLTYNDNYTLLHSSQHYMSLYTISNVK